MKKSTLILIILLIFPIVSAVELDMKSQFAKGETIIAKVSGNFLKPILRENIFFYRDHVRVSFEYDVTKINDEFYIYVRLNHNKNNYTMTIKDVQYMNGPQVSEEEITKDFEITNETADFSVNPGFIVTNDNFKVEVQNLLDQKISITVEDEEAVNTIDVKSGGIKDLEFEVEDVDEEVLRSFVLSTTNTQYEIPVYLLSKDNSSQKAGKEFKIEPAKLEIPMATDSETKRIIYVYNTGNKLLKNITLSISKELEPYVLFETQEIEEVRVGEDEKIEVYFSSGSVEKTMSGRITAEERGVFAYSDVSLDFIQDYIPEEPYEEPTESTKTCEEEGGKICTDEEKCSETEVKAKDDFCCKAKCEKPGSSSTGKIIGWVMLGVIIILILWFFKIRYSGAKKTVNLTKVAQGKK